MIIQIKAIEQYFHVVLFIMLYKVILTYFKSVDETLVCDHSKKAIEQYFHVVLFIMLYKVIVLLIMLNKVVLTFQVSG